MDSTDLLPFRFAETGAERGSISTSLEIEIRDFRAANRKVSAPSEQLGDCELNFTVSFLASVSPNKRKSSRSWLAVRVRKKVEGRFLYPYNKLLSWIVSIIDIEGNSRLPRSFQQKDSGKYLERPFILSKDDEFLPGGVLTLRLDIYFSWEGLLIDLIPTLRGMPMTQGLSKLVNDYFYTVPHAFCYDSDSEEDFVVFDFTSQILTLPQFHETRKRFGVYGIPPCSFPWLSPELKEGSTDNLEHIWTIDTSRDKFILSLDERQDSVGARLLKASPFIRLCANAPMKERRDKRIHFSNMSSGTFRDLLFFLEIGTLPRSRILETVEVYKLSHLLQLEELQKECSDRMLRDLDLPKVYQDLLEMADIYTDEYFLKKLLSNTLGYQNTPDYDCYV